MNVVRKAAAMVLLIAACCVPPAVTAQTPEPADPVLPADLGLGVLAPQGEPIVDGWMPQTGVPWTYAYEYLAGGVNTKTGWETWSAQYPLSYANRAAEHGYTPVFVYDQLLGNDGECEDCNEWERRLRNLNDSDLMADYYADFTRAMRYLSQGGVDGLGFGGRVIVDVEPHLSGTAHLAVADEDACYGFCVGSGDHPSRVEAAVKSSGNKDVAEFDDTYQGFNAAMLHLRDTYAPNVRLGFHVSTWAVEEDISLSDDPTLDAGEIGEAVGRFAARSGTSPIRPDVSTYDVLFHDLDWTDAGYRKYVNNEDPAFWDRRNVQFPNFRRWLRWSDAITSRTGLPLLVMNVPVGNQSHVAVDNTQWHFQDNRAEYFFAHIDELREAGIAALLFGSTTTGSTVAWDASGDGVHNPKQPKCTTDGDSSGERICPSVRTNLEDDDGGFLRTKAREFYASLEPSARSTPLMPGAIVVALIIVLAGGLAVAHRRRAPAPVADRAQPSGDSIGSGRFEIVRSIGSGAMKEVHLAHDTILERDVALAVLRREQLDEAGMQRAMREVRALARLGDHPHIVTVYDTGQQGTRPYFVCQYLSGGSLRDLLDARGRLDVREAIRIASEVCDALAHAHAAGIVHRDVKPANVLLDDHGRALLGDFGIAAAVDRTRLTGTGAVLGTVSYMAPEQAKGETVPASDVYSLGAMLHELIVGRPPFTGDMMHVLYQHMNASPPVPSAAVPTVPPALDALVAELLTKDPHARPEAAATLARLRTIAVDPAPDAVLDETLQADVTDDGRT